MTAPGSEDKRADRACYPSLSVNISGVKGGLDSTLPKRFQFVSQAYFFKAIPEYGIGIGSGNSRTCTEVLRMNFMH